MTTRHPRRSPILAPLLAAGALLAGCGERRAPDPGLRQVPAAARGAAVVAWPEVRASAGLARLLKAERVEREMADLDLPSADVASITVFVAGREDGPGLLVAGRFDARRTLARLRAKGFTPRRLGSLDALCDPAGEQCAAELGPGLLAGGAPPLLLEVERARSDSAARFVSRAGVAALLARESEAGAGAGTPGARGPGAAPVRAYVPLGSGEGRRTAEELFELFGGDAVGRVLAALRSAEALAVGLSDDGGTLQVRIDAPLRDEAAARAASNALELLGGLAGPLGRGARRDSDRALLDALSELATKADGRFVVLAFPVPRRP